MGCCQNKATNGLKTSLNNGGLIEAWRTFHGMVFASSTLKNTWISPEWILDKNGWTMPGNNPFICRDLQESFAVVWTEGIYVCLFFSLTLTCLLNEKSSTLNVSSILKKINVLCVDTVDVCTCKFGICGTKRSRKTIPKKSSIWIKNLLCVVFVFCKWRLKSW